MTILSDIEIDKLCTTDTPMISPYISEPVREIDGRKVLSYGLSSFGYDVRLDTNFKLFTNVNSVLIDPKDLNPRTLVDMEAIRAGRDTYIIVPPHSYVLGNTIETFDIPDDIMILCVGKSTLARCCVLINVTPVEPGFKGHVVIEISNNSSLPVKVYANEGIGQFLFFKGNMACRRSYNDKLGKYQNQARGITLPKV